MSTTRTSLYPLATQNCKETLLLVMSFQHMIWLFAAVLQFGLKHINTNWIECIVPKEVPTQGHSKESLNDFLSLLGMVLVGNKTT